MSVLPEGCISSIVSLTSPRDACRASSISVEFKSAGDSDAVWDRFLPPDYLQIIARSVSPVVFGTKKQLYFQLSDSHILVDGGKMSFKLDKWSGKKCYMLQARELSIVWDDHPQYWQWSAVPESKFPEVAVLVNVCWLEIRGKMRTRLLSSMTNYAAYLVFRITQHSNGLDVPARTSVRLVGGNTSENGGEASETSNVYLKRPSPPRRRPFRRMPRQEINRLPEKRMDGWMEIELGEFFNGNGDDGEVGMVFKEIKLGHWKRGLVVEGMELRPKEKA